MTKRIFRGILCVSLLTLLACLIFTVGVQYQIYGESRREGLARKAQLISLTADSIELYSDAEERVTLIDKSGSVLYDNKSDPQKMANHLERQEIKDALKNGIGYSVRQSETLGVNTCYYAIKLPNGNILRVSDNSYSVGAVLLELSPPIAAIAVAVFVLSLILASIISGRILKPLDRIDLDRPEPESCYEELAPFITKINLQRGKINRQIAELTRGRREFEIIAENMSEGLVLTDKKGQILTHNTSIELFFGVTKDINGENILSLNRSAAFRDIFADIRQNRRGSSLLESDGRYYEIIGSPVTDESAVLCGAMILVIDITEKEKREQLRRAFTANVSHELKTPLTSILGISDMLQNGMVAPADMKDFAKDINSETTRLITLVNDIIKLSELDEGAPREFATVDLLAVSREVAEKLKPIAEKSDITLTLSGEKAEITAGESLVFEMIYNLCDNAIKYNKPGGKVELITGNTDGTAFISVKDTGIGIARGEQERVFERFYRVDKSRSKQSGGTGLGLSIVKHIADAFDGTIRLESEPDKGTEITVSFPKK